MYQRRRIAFGVAASLLGPIAQPLLAQEADWPARPVRIIVPFAAGGGSDVAIRQLVVHMGPMLKAQFIIENRPGAEASIGASAAFRAAPDGYTLLMTSLTSQVVNPHTMRRLSYEPLTFEPIGLIGFTAPVLLCHPEARARSVAAIIELAKSQPGTLNFGAPNTSSRFAAEMFAHHAGIRLQHVRYNSAPQAHNDLAGGRIDYMFGDFTAGGPLLQAGRLQAIAVAAPERLASHPSVPTMAELGLPGVDLQIWTGLYAPRDTPMPIILKLNQALNAALAQDEIRSMLSRMATVAKPGSPEAFRAYQADQYEHWGRMVKLLGVEPE